MHRENARSGSLSILGNRDQILIANHQQEERKGGEGKSRTQPGEAASWLGWNCGAGSRGGGEEFARGSQKQGGRTQLGGAFGAGKVVLFVGVALVQGQLAQQVLLAGL